AAHRKVGRTVIALDSLNGHLDPEVYWLFAWSVSDYHLSIPFRGWADTATYSVASAPAAVCPAANGASSATGLASTGGGAASPAGAQSGFGLADSIAAIAASRAEDLLPDCRLMPFSLAMRVTWLRLRPSAVPIWAYVSDGCDSMYSPIRAYVSFRSILLPS